MPSPPHTADPGREIDLLPRKYGRACGTVSGKRPEPEAGTAHKREAHDRRMDSIDFRECSRVHVERNDKPRRSVDDGGRRGSAEGYIGVRVSDAGFQIASPGESGVEGRRRRDRGRTAVLSARL